MGFREAKKQVIACLRAGYVLHEARDEIDAKNIFATGSVSNEEVEQIILRARGDEYSASPHHFDRDIEVHIITTWRDGLNWYIKWYFLEPNCVFISVHH